jgi:hypothetical protein
VVTTAPVDKRVELDPHDTSTPVEITPAQIIRIFELI